MVTYEFPPTGGGGVQRVARFCRGLRDNGWEPTVICAEHIEGRPYDEELAQGLRDIRVVRLPHKNMIRAVARVLEPLKRSRRSSADATEVSSAGEAVSTKATVSTSTATRKPPWSTRIARWISSPDEASRWAHSVPAAARSLGIEFEAVLASGPPHSALVAGERCARELGIPLAIDMRDAWSSNPGMRYATRLHRNLARRHQRRVCSAASLAIAVSNPIADEAREDGTGETVVIPNGYDAREMPPLAPSPDTPLTIGFMGLFYALNDPAPLLDAMVSIRDSGGPEIRWEIVGAAEARVHEQVAERGLSDAVTFHGYLSHDRALETIAACDMGVAIIAEKAHMKGVYTGKLFEYLGMGIPALIIGPVDGAAAVLVREHDAGATVSYSSSEAIAETLRECARKKSQGEPLSTAAPGSFRRFERAEQARELSKRLSGIAGDSS